MLLKLGLGALVFVMALGIFLTVLEDFIALWPYSLYFLLIVGSVGAIVILISFKTNKKEKL